jgi:hypothetical protein
VEVDAILLENAFESSPRKRPHRAFSVLSLHRTTIKPKRKKIKIYSGKKLVMHELHESLYYLKVANLERTRLPMSAAGVQVRQCAPAKGIQHYPRSGASWNHCFHLKTQQFFDFLWIRAKRKQLNTWYQIRMYAWCTHVHLVSNTHMRTSYTIHLEPSGPAQQQRSQTKLDMAGRKKLLHRMKLCR